MEEEQQEAKAAEEQKQQSNRDRIFSSLAARLFFLLLLIVDALWGLYNILLLLLIGLFSLLSGFKSSTAKALLAKTWLSFKRSLICGVALFIALFSPSFGILIACTYFLTYDPSGIEEVVPSSLRTQFGEFFSCSPNQ